MHSNTRFGIVSLVLILSVCSAVLAEEPGARRGGRGGGGATGVYKASVEAHWFQNNTRFWYMNGLRGGTREFIMVDAEAGKRQTAFDHTKLAAGLSKASGNTYTADKLPFDTIEFTGDAKAVQFKVGDTTWKCDLRSYECAKTTASATLDALMAEISRPRADPEIASASDLYPEADDLLPGTAAELKNQGEEDDTVLDPASLVKAADSPDGQWTAFIKDQNVFIKPKSGGVETQLSKDGVVGNFYGKMEWSLDSKTLASWRIEPAPLKMVYLIVSSPPDHGRAQMRSRPYKFAGEQFAAYELSLFDVASKKQMKPQVDRLDFGVPTLRWRKDNQFVTYEKADRSHQRYRLIEVNRQTGAVRNIIDEKTETFVWSVAAPGGQFPTAGIQMTYLEDTGEIIYLTERDGWKHLYIVNEKAGDSAMKLITKGEWVVREVDKVDTATRQIWFRASGIFPDQDPYFIHYCRVNFDGTGLTILTAGDGTHTITYSPDQKYIVDNYSRVDMAPVTELRRVSDGKLVCELEKADISELLATGFQFPEVFKTKGRDGKTDIWGNIHRPRNLDPAKKYPVLEDIYAGPHSSFVPKNFSGTERYAALNNLGFIVAKVDGMGTANRSKAFHDVCWHNLKDAGFTDRILWHQAINKKYAYYDTLRVGVYGTSAGGQNAAAAVIFHPEFYKAAYANCGCHDNRMDKAWWNEQWMGSEVGPWYSECSNIDSAGKLGGRLMLVVGELDMNVPPETTYRLVNALNQAQKDYDLIVVPNGGHGSGGAYAQRRMQEFFQKHLMGIEPPNHNVAQ